jgi:hypothetical protein
VKPGDPVVVRYAEAIAAEFVRPGGAPPVSTSSVAGAAPGARPAGLVVDPDRQRVRVEGIDLASYTGAFVGPDRVLRTMAMRQPALRDFMRTLKVGDEVDVTFTEALAVSVEPAARSTGRVWGVAMAAIPLWTANVAGPGFAADDCSLCPPGAA